MQKWLILCTLQVLTGIVFASPTSPLLFNETYHLLQKQQYYSDLDRIMARQEWQNNENDQNAMRKGRIMQALLEEDQEEPLPLRITVDFDQEEGIQLSPELDNYTRKVLNTAIRYFESLIRIKRIRENNTFFFTELNHCLGFEIKQELVEQGIPNSDLHLFTSFTLSDSDLIATAGHCYVDPILNRPTFGRIVINLSHFKRNSHTNLQFNRDLQSIMHEILHILGFSPESMNYWIDPLTGKPYSRDEMDKILSQKWFNQEEMTVLTSRNVVRTAREYYGCDEIVGMQFENQGSDLTKNQHWERSILMNELMTGSSNPGAGVFSIFTVALLRDTGFWNVVDENLAGKIYWGKNKGCQFFEQKCQADLKYTEFENSEGILNCSYTGEGYGVSQVDPYSDNCNIIYPTDESLCINYELKRSQKEFNSAEQDNLMTNYSTQSRCFKSSLSKDDYGVGYPEIRCHRAECNEEGDEVQIHLDSINMTLVCAEEGEELLVDDGIKFYGMISCPSNFAQFCASFQNTCPQFCSQNGFCVKGKCHCNKGFFGNDCSQKCEEVNEDGSCVISCSAQTYQNPDGTCQIACPEGYFKNDTHHTCERCHHTCSKCNGPTEKSCTSCHFLQYLEIGQCIDECERGSFKNKDKKICQKCAEGCTSCTSLNYCEECDTDNFYLEQDSLCKNTQCNTSCLTCQADSLEVCTSCPLNTFMDKVSNKCVDNKSCSKGFFADASIRECARCAEGCTSCSQRADKCQSCDESKSYTLFGSECFKLVNCFSPCQTCVDPLSPIRCATCVKDYFLQEEDCVQECASGYFQQHNSCMRCSENCDTCTDSRDNCLTCSAGHYLIGSQCLSRCEKGQKWVDEACIEAPIEKVDSSTANKKFSFAAIGFVLLIILLM